MALAATFKDLWPQRDHTPWAGGDLGKGSEGDIASPAMSGRPRGQGANPHGINLECHRMPPEIMARTPWSAVECQGIL